MVWDIFDDIRRMQEEMDQMFSDFFSHPGYRRLGPGRAVQKAGSESEGTPARMRAAFADVQETDTDVIVTVELPGVTKEDIKLHVTSDRVEIKAEKKEEAEKEEEGYRAYRKRYAGFYRQVPLPQQIEPDHAKATYKNGVLEITLPKKEVTKSTDIKIE
jgi:HSP20 family protein